MSSIKYQIQMKVDGECFLTTPTFNSKEKADEALKAFIYDLNSGIIKNLCVLDNFREYYVIFPYEEIKNKFIRLKVVSYMES